MDRVVGTGVAVAFGVAVGVGVEVGNGEAGGFAVGSDRVVGVVVAVAFGSAVGVGVAAGVGRVAGAVVNGSDDCVTDVRASVAYDEEEEGSPASVEGLGLLVSSCPDPEDALPIVSASFKRIRK